MPRPFLLYNTAVKRCKRRTAFVRHKKPDAVLPLNGQRGSALRLHRRGGVRQVLGTGHVEGVRLTGQTIPCEGVFILRASIAPDSLLPGLATENGFVTVDRQMATNLPGVFAAGDITGTPLQVAKAVGEGLTAALSAARWLYRQAAAQP